MKVTPTGRMRYRTARVGLLRRREVLVLEVEERIDGYELVCHGADPDHVTYLRWRDARPEDITVGAAVFPHVAAQ